MFEDPDPLSAGTAGEAAVWGGSSAVVGMAANPFGAHQAGIIHSAQQVSFFQLNGAFAANAAARRSCCYAKSANFLFYDIKWST